MKKRFIITIIILIVGLHTRSLYAEGLNIEINAPQLPGKPLKLVNYFNGSNYTQDSLMLSSEGTGAFQKDYKLPEGLYLIYLDSVHFFDLLIADDQAFRLSIDTTGFIQNNQIEGAEQSEAFLEYARFISGKQKERNTLAGEYQALKAENKGTETITAQIDTLNNQVLAFQKAFFEKHNGQWVANFFKGLSPVTTGPYPAPATREEAMQEFQYQKYHYFDNIDLKDPRFWYTNYFTQKVEQYISRQVEFIPDSIANAASWLVSKTKGDSICFRMMLGKLTNYAIRSDLMGMENVWAKLAEDYYFKDTDYEADSAFLANLNTEYRKIKYNRIGMTAQNLVLQDSTGKEVKLYDMTDEYTLVYFFEPSCGHCKKTTPVLHDSIYEKYKDRGFSVICVCTIDDRAEWLKFVFDHNLTDWHNVWDPERISYFWQFYDTSTTPGVYLIDKNKRIVAKKLDIENLDRLLSNVLPPAVEKAAPKP